MACSFTISDLTQKKDDIRFKEQIYDRYASKMYGICLRFAGNEMEADDILQEGFIKVFSKLDHFRNEGSFEGWLRRTFVNTAINYYKRNKRYAQMSDVSEVTVPDSCSETIYDILSKEELMNLVQSLPTGYRTVFNLNVIEGYTHKEIGEMLNISDNTSKSQLARAKQTLREKIEKLTKEKIRVPFEDFTVYRNEKSGLQIKGQYLQAG